MASRHEYVDQVKAELQAIRDTGMVTSEQWFARAMRYVAENPDEVAEMAFAEGVKDTADNVLVMTETCIGGKCE